MSTIKEIKKLKDFASFEDYEWNPDILNDFEKYNLFYGLNGSGKTTFSRFLYFLNEGAICNEGQYGRNFSVLLDDNTEITQFDNNPLKGKICVFNDLFTEYYLDFKTVKSKKIVYFSAGKDTKMLLTYKNTLEHRKQIISDKIKKVKEEHALLSDNNRKIYEDYQDSVVDTLDTNKNKFKITIATSKLDELKQHESFLPLSAQKIDEQKNLYAQINLPILNYLYPKKYSLSIDDIDELSNLLREKIERKNLSDIRNEIAEWLNHGITYQSEQSNQRCVFCNQELPSAIWEERMQQILYMTEKDSAFQKKEQLIIQYSSKIQNIILSPFIVNENDNDFYQVYKTEFSGIKKSLPIEYESIKPFLEQLNYWLLEKLKDTKSSIDISKIIVENNLSLYENLIMAIKNINIILTKFESLFIKNNKHSTSLSEEQKQAFDNICNHCAIPFIEKLTLNNEALKRNDLDQKKYDKLLNKIETQLKEKVQELANSDAPIEEINTIIQQIMGKNKFFFEKDGIEGQFKIQRIEKHKHSEAINLSEGEKNIISFAFFMTFIKEKIPNSIIVIDDPISSLDSSYFFNLLNLLLGSKLVKHKQLKQLFIMTHNFYFFKKLRKSIKGEKCPQIDINGNIKRDTNGKPLFKYCKYSQKYSLENKQIYQIVKNNYSSSIQPPSDYLRKYNSEYLTLIEQFIKYKNDLDSTSYQYCDGIGILNVMRRILETFLENKYPTLGGEHFYEKFHSTITKLSRDDLLYLSDILNIGSHGENSFPSLNYTKFEDFTKLTDDFLEYLQILDREFYDNVFQPLIHSKIAES